MGEFAAPVRWQPEQETTTLSAAIRSTTLRLLTREPLTATECPDLLLVGLRIELQTSDGGLAGTLEADAALSQKGDIREPLWVHVRGWQNDLRGSVELRTGSLGEPHALELSFNLLLSDGEAPRMGVEILGLYAQDPDAGNEGFTTPLAEAAPADACPVFTIVDGDDCSSVPPP